MDYGLQMYSVRDITGNDLKGALKAVAEMGYKFVEFAGFFGHSAADVKAMLDEYGLVCSGTHTSWLEVANDFDATVAYHKTIGNKNIIVPGADLRTKPKLDAFIAMVKEVTPKLAAEGITFQYHNHAHEFAPNQDGQIVHDVLAQESDIMFEIDTYWAYVGKRDPIKLLEQYKNRVSVIHLKDGLESGKGLAIGEGTAPVLDVIAKCKELGITMVVESEGLDPDGLSEVKRCIDYLKKLG